MHSYIACGELHNKSRGFGHSPVDIRASARVGVSGSECG